MSFDSLMNRHMNLSIGLILQGLNISDQETQTCALRLCSRSFSWEIVHMVSLSNLDILSCEFEIVSYHIKPRFHHILGINMHRAVWSFTYLSSFQPHSFLFFWKSAKTTFLLLAFWSREFTAELMLLNEFGWKNFKRWKRKVLKMKHLCS